MVTHQKARAAIRSAYKEFEQLLENHPLREKWLPRLDELTANVEEAFQSKDLPAFEVALDDLGIYITQIKHEAAQSNYG